MSNITTDQFVSIVYICSYIDFIICLLLTEIFGHIRRTLFDSDGVPYADMRALANEEFKVTGELMACSLVQGGPAPSFLSMNVYDYLVDGMSSVQSEKWASLVTDNSLRQSMERVILTFCVFTVCSKSYFTTVIKWYKSNVLAHTWEPWQAKPLSLVFNYFYSLILNQFYLF